MKDYLAGDEQSLEAAANALAGVANKGITAQTVTDLNAVLGLSAVTDDVASQIADTAKAAQANKAGSLQQEYQPLGNRGCRSSPKRRLTSKQVERGHLDARGTHPALRGIWRHKSWEVLALVQHGVPV